MSLQSVTQPDPQSCFFLPLAPFPTHVGTSHRGKATHSKLSSGHGKPCVFPSETPASDQEEVKAVDFPTCLSTLS